MSTFELHDISLFFACQVNFCFEEEESSAMDIHTLWSFFNNKNQLPVNKVHWVESVYVKICKADLHVQSWFQIMNIWISHIRTVGWRIKCKEDHCSYYVSAWRRPEKNFFQLQLSCIFWLHFWTNLNFTFFCMFHLLASQTLLSMLFFGGSFVSKTLWLSQLIISWLSQSVESQLLAFNKTTLISKHSSSFNFKYYDHHLSLVVYCIFQI